MSSVPEIAYSDEMPGFTRPSTPIATPIDAEIDAEAAWKQLLARDAQAEFFYGVTTTGVFCRPGCASRRPLRHHVRFFSTAEDARAAGFRPCQRCKPNAPRGNAVDRIRTHIEEHLDRKVSLEELGEKAGVSSYTAQRLFKRAMGVSPLAYQRALRAGRMRAALKKGESVTDAIYSAGFGSASRAYEGNPLGMTPARFAQGGRGEEIGYASARTSFGWMVVGATERGLCWLALGATQSDAERTLREEFPEALLRRDASLARWIDAAAATAGCVGKGSLKAAARQTPELDLRGTAFQLRVWQALQRIPRGETRSYSQLARELGDPKATRAVARACATNRVAVLVPCHRVVGASGSLTGYRWGIERKRQLLDAERA